MAAALGLDEEHVGELGVRRPDLRVGGEQGVVGRGDRRRPLAVHRRDVEPGPRRQCLEQRRARRGRPDRLRQLDDRLLGFTEQQDVGVGTCGDGVREGEGAADHHQRVAFWVRDSLLGEDRDAGQVKAVDQTGQLELVGEREGDHREVAHRSRRLVRPQRLARHVRRLGVVGEKGPLGGDARQRVQAAVDGLEPERRHPDRVRARVTERERQPRLFVDGPHLGGEALSADVAKGHGHLGDRE